MSINYKWALVALMFLLNNEIVSWLILTALAIMFFSKLMKGVLDHDN